MGEKITALDLGPAAELSEATQGYFAKCQEKLGLIPNVLLSYAFDEKKLRAFTDMYNDLMLGEFRSVETGTRNDRGGSLVGKSLLLLPGRTRGCSKAAVGRPGARRNDGHELSRRNAFAAPQGHARFLGQAHRNTGENRRSGPRWPAKGRVLGSRHLGHRLHCSILQHVESGSGGCRYAAQFRISRDGAIRHR